MQQTFRPSYQLNLQGLAKLWLSTRHRMPTMAVGQEKGSNHHQTSSSLSPSTASSAVLTQLSHVVQDAETVWQNRQSLYAIVKRILNDNDNLTNDTVTVGEHWEPALDDMLADHLTSLSMNLEKAKEVQQHFFPQSLPDVFGVDLFAVLRPATELSGDFYDFICDGSTEDGTDAFFFSVGDVSSKGMSAALLMPVICKVLRTAIKYLEQPTPEALLTFTHDDMYTQLNRSAMFASMFVGRYDPVSRIVDYANAGHSPVIYKPLGEPARLLKADGSPVGLLQQGSWKNHTLTLAPGDLLLIGTDGIVDIRTSMRKMFGYDRLLTAVERVANGSARTIANDLLSILNDFAPNQQREDDQALLVFKGV